MIRLFYFLLLAQFAEVRTVSDLCDVSFMDKDVLTSYTLFPVFYKTDSLVHYFFFLGK